jgi:hypothetical protein
MAAATALAQQKTSRLAFGRMLLNWRRRNGWTQYTACHWAEAIGDRAGHSRGVTAAGLLAAVGAEPAHRLRRLGPCW